MPRRNNASFTSALLVTAMALSTQKVDSFSPMSLGSFRALQQSQKANTLQRRATDTNSSERIITDNLSFWEKAAQNFVADDYASNAAELRKYVQILTIIRVGIPSFVAGVGATVVYPDLSMYLASVIDSKEALDVVANDYSQYIQNILTTCGLMFTIMTGYTYYFLYQQQEAIYNSFFHEVSVASSLMEQVALVCQGREDMHQDILASMDRYIKEDLTQFNTEPSVLLSRRPIDDPLEDIFYLTSVGEPSVIYQTVRSLRQARAARLGHLQKKLPPIQGILLTSLATIVLCTFPLLGAGSQTIGGPGILHVQSIYMFFIVFGITMVLGVIKELREPAGRGAYNVVVVLSILVDNLENELSGRMDGKFGSGMRNPSADGVHYISALHGDLPVTNCDDDEDNDFDEFYNELPKVEIEALKDGEWIGKRIARGIRNKWS